MKRTRPWLSAFFLGPALLVASAAGPVIAGEKSEDEKEDQHYVDFSEDHPMGEVRSDMALVYVVRPGMMGFAIKSFFLSDQQVLGINKGDSYFFAHVPPGKHAFWSKSENVDAIELSVEAGKTYYLKQAVRMGGLKARTKLLVLDEVEGKEALAKCGRHATMTSKGRAKGAEYAERLMPNVQKDIERKARKQADVD